MPTLFLALILQLAKAACLLSITGGVVFADVKADYERLEQAGYMVSSDSSLSQQQSRADELFVPASTVKLITAYLCLEHWGEHHRFSTEFYFDNTNDRLWVKAGGDPFLVSEEISLIASALAKMMAKSGVSSVGSIGLDVSMFAPDLVVPGATTTDNPYDAVPSALAANFNTLHIKKTGSTVVSAEPQTPLTPLAKKVGHRLRGIGARRVNTGRESADAERYFAELLKAMLVEEGLEVADEVIWGSAPEGTAFYAHRNTRTLGEVLEGMLKYSTNFIANQLMLTLVAQKADQAANFTLVGELMQQSLREEFGWTEFSLLEGAGLSRDNRLTARQLTDVVRRFVRWQHLLPEVAPGVHAKTGTLTDVKTLAGFATGSAGGIAPFAILINESVPRDLPVQLIQSLSK